MAYVAGMAEPVYTSVVALAKLVFRGLGVRFDISGADNVPRTGGAVMAVNHIGYLDFTFAGLAAQPAGRLVRFMAKKQVFDHRVSGPLMRGMKHIPVDRTGAAADSYRAAVTALRAGEIVGVFPEATISESYDLKEFKNGAARMAREAGVPMVPMVIWGSQRVWTKGHPKRLGRTCVPIRIVVGDPIHVAPGESIDEATTRIHEVMAQLLHDLQEGYEPMTGEDLKYLPARLGGTAPTLEDATRIEDDERREMIRRASAERKAARTPKA